MNKINETYYRIKINETYNKIIVLIEENFSDSTKRFQHFRFKNAVEPIKNRKVLYKLFLFGSPDEIDLEILELKIKDSKKIAKQYHKPKLVIGDDMFSKAIILYYYETQKEIYDRLVRDYEELKKEAVRIKADELEKYNVLKAKYEKILK